MSDGGLDDAVRRARAATDEAERSYREFEARKQAEAAERDRIRTDLREAVQAFLERAKTAGISPQAVSLRVWVAKKRRWEKASVRVETFMGWTVIYPTTGDYENYRTVSTGGVYLTPDGRLLDHTMGPFPRIDEVDLSGDELSIESARSFVTAVIDGMGRTLAG